MYKESNNDTVSTQRTLGHIYNTTLDRVSTNYGGNAKTKTDIMLGMHGLHMDNFDFLKTVDTIVGAKVKTNDISIDDNSNKSNKHINAAVQESVNPIKKAIGFDYLYRSMKEMYGKDEATRLTGKMMDYTLGLSDETSICSQYCWAFNASLFVVGGKDFGSLRLLPPKNVGEYVSGLSEIIHEFAGNLAGALAIGTYFIDFAHIMLCEEKIDIHELRASQWIKKMLKSEYRQFIQSCNQLSRNAIESPFINVSIFDRSKISKLLEEFSWYFPHEELPINKPDSIENKEALNKYYNDILTEYIIDLQNCYLEVFDKGDPARNGAPLRFPVTTANVGRTENGTDKIADMAFLKMLCNKEIFRYNLFASEGSKIASCCFRGDTTIDVTLTYGEDPLRYPIQKTIRFDELYALIKSSEVPIRVSVIAVGASRLNMISDAEVIEIDYELPWHALKLSDSTTMTTTNNHKNAYYLTDDFYADIESDKIKTGTRLFTNNDAVVTVVGSSTVVNHEKKAYCLQLRSLDATHFVMPNSVVTHNCRLINDTEMMNLASQSNSFGAGGSVSLGSHRVVTNNTVRSSLVAEDLNDFYKIVSDNIDDSAKILSSHKKLLRDLEKQGCQPFISAGWIDLNRSFSTFGLIGIWETIQILNKKFGLNEDAMEDLLRFINTCVELSSKKYGITGNIEQIPGESFANRLCQADKVLFDDPEELSDINLYSNQIVPSWDDSVSIWDRMEISGKHMKLFTGGGIEHWNIGEKLTPTQVLKLIKYAIKCGCEHMAFNPVFCECRNGHFTFKDKHGDGKCPTCGADIVEEYTRIIGYFSPVGNWNKGRKKYDYPLRARLDVNSEPPTKK